MKSQENIQALKDNWSRDPCWSIEDTEGFEEHRTELIAFREEKEAQWKEQAAKHKAELASKRCPIILFSRQGSEGSYQHIYENSGCLVDQCAWWNAVKDCCVIRALTLP